MPALSPTNIPQAFLDMGEKRYIPREAFNVTPPVYTYAPRGWTPMLAWQSYYNIELAVQQADADFLMSLNVPLILVRQRRNTYSIYVYKPHKLLISDLRGTWERLRWKWERTAGSELTYKTWAQYAEQHGGERETVSWVLQFYAETLRYQPLDPQRYLPARRASRPAQAGPNNVQR